MQPDKKGDFYIAVIEKQGRPAIDVHRRHRAARWCAAFPGRSRCAGAVGAGCYLGAAAAFDRGDVRAGDRRARDRAVRHRRHRSRRRHARPPLHGAGANQGAALRRLHRQARKRESRARSGAARGDRSCADAKNLAFAQGYELVEDEACWPKSPAWSNGRWC